MRTIPSRKPKKWGWLILAGGLTYLLLFLLFPLAIVFIEAFSKGYEHLYKSITSDDTTHAIWLSFLSALIAVPLNTVFGVMAAWAITKFQFRGKQVLLTIIDLPFAVSPVIGGLIFVLLYGKNSWLGGWIESEGYKIIFAKPGLVMVTMFVTLPFVVRELVPLMQSQGTEEEQTAVTLGAKGWFIFRKVTLPNIKWALIYGVILTNARAIGEFGAASVVSGFIRRETVTIPLQIEILFNEYNAAGAFACATLLTMFGLFTLVVKSYVEYRSEREENRR
jgi:sulfate transport system permease protein